MIASDIKSLYFIFLPPNNPNDLKLEVRNVRVDNGKIKYEIWADYSELYNTDNFWIEVGNAPWEKNDW